MAGVVGGDAAPGDYLIVTVQGPAQVRAANLNIQSGDVVYPAAASGVSAEATGQPIGLALDSVDDSGFWLVLISTRSDSMKRRLTLIWALILLAAALGAGIVVARSAWQSSANYAIPWDVVAEGGGEMSSASCAVEGTIGQPAIGPISSSSYAIGGGYWYGIGKRSVAVYLPVLMK